MSKCNEYDLLNGGDSMGMTDSQYKGMLLDQLRSWTKVLKLATECGNTEIQEEAKEQVDMINEKLKF